MIALRITFEGRVQGIGFRYTTKDLAKSFDVCGSVQNLADGSVEMHVMGEATEIEDFLREISEESAVAHHIRNVRRETVPLFEGLKGFRILAQG
jgi:acylphosphatase